MTLPSDWPREPIYGISEDAERDLWLGRWHDGKSTQLRKADGLPSDYVWSLLAEENGDLWISTFGGGLCRLRGNQFSSIGASEGLPNMRKRLEEIGGHCFIISSPGNGTKVTLAVAIH